MAMDRGSPDFCAFEWGTCEEISEKSGQHMFHMCKVIPPEEELYHDGPHECGDCSATKRKVGK
jgi:hypothetical protein